MQYKLAVGTTDPALQGSLLTSKGEWMSKKLVNTWPGVCTIQVTMFFLFIQD